MLKLSVWLQWQDLHRVTFLWQSWIKCLTQVSNIWTPGTIWCPLDLSHQTCSMWTQHPGRTIKELKLWYFPLLFPFIIYPLWLWREKFSFLHEAASLDALQSMLNIPAVPIPVPQKRYFDLANVRCCSFRQKKVIFKAHTSVLPGALLIWLFHQFPLVIYDALTMLCSHIHHNSFFN